MIYTTHSYEVSWRKVLDVDLEVTSSTDAKNKPKTMGKAENWVKFTLGQIAKSYFLGNSLYLTHLHFFSSEGSTIRNSHYKMTFLG